MTYTATLTREDGMWLGEIQDLAGVHAYARTLTRLRQELAVAVILFNGLDDLDDTEVEIEFQVADDSLLTQAFEIAQRRHQLRHAEEAVVAETASVARSLIDAGWSVRDTAGALDITAARVSQLAKLTDLIGVPFRRARTGSG
ncbi:MAG: hypothetical protein K0U20_08315 [Proteobacteria bacterium]|nr:hypothetical protein [Pseudomonadota bacterium]